MSNGAEFFKDCPLETPSDSLEQRGLVEALVKLDLVNSQHLQAITRDFTSLPEAHGYYGTKLYESSPELGIQAINEGIRLDYQRATQELRLWTKRVCDRTGLHIDLQNLRTLGYVWPGSDKACNFN